MPVNDRMAIYVGGEMTYRSKAYGGFIKDERLAEKAYTVVDAHIGGESRDHAWLAELFGNIFNEYYYPTALRASDTVYRFTGDPATYGVRVSFRFR